MLLLGADALLMPLALWLSFCLRLGLDQPWSDQWLQSGPWMIAALWLFGLPLLVLTGQYKGLTRYVGSRSLYQMSVRMAVLTWHALVPELRLLQPRDSKAASMLG